MIDIINCVYKTPCGWCSKWDKECDKKMHGKSYSTVTNANKMCAKESDHEWEFAGLSTVGTTYRCKKCNATKLYPCDFNNGGITVTTV